MRVTTVRYTIWLAGALTALLFSWSCSLRANIPTISDHAIERLVRVEAERIVAVSEDRGHFEEYQILLSDFPRRDILGMSVGSRRIYISYELGRLASRQRFYLWLLRQTLAHEIAHETSGHAQGARASGFNRLPPGQGVSGADIGLPSHVRFHAYALDRELEADSKGLLYWRELQWDCRIWLNILKHFQRHDYDGDISHPTDQRLRQAERICQP